MPRVPDRVLQWLYKSLSTQYENVDRTYTDIVKCLSQYTTLSPRTDVHTDDHGRSALLLVLQGTVPVQFKASIYHFPLALWLPYSYPREPPMIYVTPTDTMLVRPGQHVSVEGRIYHPYLAHWRDHWNMSNLIDFLSIVQDVFAKEPPVVSRQQQAAVQSRPPPQNSLASPPPVPQRPGEHRPPELHSQPTSSQQAVPLASPPPPPPPPKPLEVSNSPSSRHHQEDASNRFGQIRPPELPPKPHSQNGVAISPVSPRAVDGPHEVPFRPMQLPQARQNVSSTLRSSFPVSPADSPGLDLSGQPIQPPPPPNPLYQPTQGQYTYPPSAQPMSFDRSRQELSASFSPPNVLPTNRAPPPPQTQQPASKPAEDLLSGPLDALQATNASNDISKIAPPIPPNPEKDELLQRLTTELTNKLNQALSQNVAAVTSLEAQYGAMHQAYVAMQSELAELQGLDNVLTSNEKILHEAVREADRVMESMDGKEVPNVDDVLVAPTIVGEQLYGLVADARAIDDAMFALTRALDAGRVEGDVFVKQTRMLAREQFLKKALIKKIGRGMGLAVDS